MPRREKYKARAAFFHLLESRRVSCLIILSLLLLSPLAGAAGTPSQAAAAASKIKHIFIFVQENHSFDNYFGYYPGVNGLAEATPQFDPNDSEYVSPFEIDNATIPSDLCHSQGCAQDDYDHGLMNHFVSGEDNKETMGYFNPDLIPYYWDYAEQYVLMDNWYTPFMGPSLPNHMYLLAGTSGGLTTNNINLTFSFPTIVNELYSANVSWAFFAGNPYVATGWNPLPDSTQYIKDYPEDQGLYDTNLFPIKINESNFPSVAWVMPYTDQLSEHPPYNVTSGEEYTVKEINDIMNSQYWDSSLIVLTWDDYGGWYDSAAPPQIDQFGLGFRAPALIISPYAKQGFVDNTLTEDASTLSLIETIFHVAPLSPRDAKADNLLEALNFNQPPRAPLVLPGQFKPNVYPPTYLDGNVLGPLPQGQPGVPLPPSPSAGEDNEYAGLVVLATSALIAAMASVSLLPSPRGNGTASDG